MQQTASHSFWQSLNVKTTFSCPSAKYERAIFQGTNDWPADFHKTMVFRFNVRASGK